jgi:predicted AAA+ superfamily ATPase
MSMLAKLERLIGEIGDLNSKLILLVGPSRSGKTQLLRQLGVAVWPGELRGDRLVYADMSHPEHRDYSRDGVVVLEI